MSSSESAVAMPQITPLGESETQESSAEDTAACQAPFCKWLVPDAEQRCMRAQLPQEDARPVTGTTVDDELEPFFVAFEKLWLGETPLPGGQASSADQPWYVWGFDLDGYCTSVEGCGGGTPQPKNLGCTQQGTGVPVDGPFCADNMFAQLHATLVGIARAGAAYGLTESALNCGLQHGDFNQLLRISGYNGEREDGQVRIDFYASPGMEVRNEGWECPSTDLAAQPTWFASSRWLVAEESLDPSPVGAEVAPVDVAQVGGASGASVPAGLPGSLTAVDDAFVVDGYLIAQIPSYPLLLPGDRATQPLGWRVVLQEAWLVGRLVRRADGTWSIEDGVLSGRQPVVAIEDRLHELGVCFSGETEATFRQIAAYLAHFADVSATAESTTAEAPCDAISTAIGFTAAQVEAGEVMSLQVTDNCCRDQTSLRCQTNACGNGVLDVGELCDPLIPAGEEGRCPSACPPVADGCAPLTLVEAGCQTRCEVVNLDDAADPVVMVDGGTDCVDGQSCGGAAAEVSEGQTGSEMATAVDGGESGQCVPEATDGESLCTGTECAAVVPTDVCQSRLANALVEEVSADCSACACSTCNAGVGACLDTDPPEDAELCGDLLSCVLTSACNGLDCYMGPCQLQAEAAGRTLYWPGPDPRLLIDLNNTSLPLGVTSMLSRCVREQCSEACGVAPSLLTPSPAVEPTQ